MSGAGLARLFQAAFWAVFFLATFLVAFFLATFLVAGAADWDVMGAAAGAVVVGVQPRPCLRRHAPSAGR